MKILQLQGARGAAAITVVMSHAFGIFYLTGQLGPHEPYLGPLSHLFGILAVKAVWLFFVLSGFVLQFMVEKGEYSTRLSLALSRWLRLFIPAVTTVTIGFILGALFPPPSRDSFWVGANPLSLSPLEIASQFTLLSPGFTVGPLWSITWEIVYSVLLLPLIIGISLTKSWLAVILLSAISALGLLMEFAPLEYMPMFLIGVVLHALYKDKSMPKVALKLLPELLFWGSASLLVLNYALWSLAGNLTNTSYAIDVFLSLTAIAAFLAIALRDGLTSRVLRMRILTRTGEISYSLYLIHVPIMVSAYYGSSGSALFVFLATVSSFPLAVLFHRFVEKPSHALSRKVSGRAT